MSKEIGSDFINHSKVPKAILARQIIEQAWDLYCQLDAHGNLIYASSRFYEIMGSVPVHIEQFIEAVDVEFRLDVYKLFVHTLQTKTSSKLEFRVRGAGEANLWLECTAISLCDEKGELIEIAFALQDRTQHKNQESHLIAMAFHDPLTGLPNRRLFKEHVHQLLKLAKRTDRMFALLYVDIDDFKIINDTMGHDVGDAFLQEFVERVKSCLREFDMFARMGGDEFTILLPAVDCQEHVEGIARRIVASVEQTWEVQGHNFRSTVSMGITMYRSDHTDVTQMMKEADIALYQVKGKGRNHYRFYSHG